MNIVAVIGCLIGIALMWIPFKRAERHREMAWRNEAWAEDIQDLRFLAASWSVAFCIVGTIFMKRVLGL